MRMPFRSVVILSLALLSGDALGAGLPNFDAFGARPRKPGSDAALLKKAEAAVNPGVRLQSESRLGVPTFLWVAGSHGASLAAAAGRTVGDPMSPEESAARAALAQFGSLYGLSSTDVASATVSMVHNTGRGAIIVKFRQQVGGTDIFHEEINVLMNRKLEALAISGYISSAATPAAQGGSLSFALGASAAAATAVRDVTRAGVNASEFVSVGSEGGYQKLTLPASSAARLDEAVRVKPVYFHWPEGLEAAYYVEVIGRSPDHEPGVLDATGAVGSNEGYAYVVSAVNGSLLFRKSLSADAGFTYRVWADPVTRIPYDTPAGNGPHPKTNPLPDGAQAPFVPTNDVALLNFPFSRNDPWLAPGSTETSGNNADAFLNLFAPDGYGNPVTTAPADPPNGDYRAQITAADQFLHTHVPDVTTSSADARQASIQQLFYDVNFLHDWYYDSGFDEASLNAQTNNFGRGGLGNDNIKAQVQDFSGFSNANMLTPADGARPRMRMYVFPSLANHLDIQAPAAIVGKADIGVTIAGPQSFDITNDIVIATFTSGPSTCTITNAAALDGKIAMFDFDNTDGTGCSFTTRILRITSTNALAALMVYTSAVPTVVANITGFVTTFTKPIATISWNTGLSIKGQLSMPATVTTRLLRAPDRDGTLDNQIVFHEWAHYLSNRLVGNASGLSTQQSGGMGEGWGDINSMMLTVRQDDTSVPSNATWNGAYALATYATSGVPFNGAVNDSYYFGIRRYPYSTDMTKNPLTFTHIQNGVPLPVGPPVAFGASGSNNAEVHNTGEVWTTMLWECYAALLRDTQGGSPRLTFQQAQDRMKGYLVASLKMTPVAPTFTEARDAVLAAALANDVVDYVEMQQAFAKRGAGIGAVSPDRFATDNVPVVESFQTGPELVFQGASVDDGLAWCVADGILDSGEYGHLVVTLKNIGTTTLTGTTATITSPSAGVSFPNGNTIVFPSSEPVATTTGSVVVAFAWGIAGIQQLDFQIDYNDPQLVGGPRTATAGFRANA
ncbi:MAG TPA: M36 family metallopeptidase, partial [Thermoanaerobaculia bacterium]|nr:M36 family metallopeptidase [Thermoanaerobaculia bacterium]